MKTFESEWRARFERFGRTYTGEADISGWSEAGLRRRVALFSSLVATLPLPATGTVLDLGCGAGRTALYFQDRGLEITAVDSSPGAVESCRLRGVRDVRLGDLNDPPVDREWATVLLLCGNLGLGGSWDGNRKLLARLAEISAPGDAPGELADPAACAQREASGGEDNQSAWRIGRCGRKPGGQGRARRREEAPAPVERGSGFAPGGRFDEHC